LKENAVLDSHYRARYFSDNIPTLHLGKKTVDFGIGEADVSGGLSFRYSTIVHTGPRPPIHRA